MEISIFVDDTQLGDRDHVKVSDSIVVRLVGIPIEGTLLVLPSVTRGIATTGIIECQFRGVVRKVRIDRVRGNVHHQALLDCGVPLVLSHRASAPLYVGDSRGRIWSELEESHIGKSLSGLALVRGDIAFTHPSLIQAEVRAQVKALKRVNLSEEHAEELDEFEYRRDKIAGMIGLLMRVEIL